MQNWVGLGCGPFLRSLLSPKQSIYSYIFHKRLCCSYSQVGLTFAIVFGVIIYRISTAAALAISSTPSGRSSVRVTVTATAVIINLVVIIILDEVYGCIARWLTQIGRFKSSTGIC